MQDEDKAKELSFQEALEYTEKVINTVYDPVIILHEDLLVAVANRAFYSLFQVNPKDTEGQFIYDLGNRQWDIPQLRHLLEEIIPNVTSIEDFKIEHTFPGIGIRNMLLNACRVYINANRTKLIIITIRDITAHKTIDELTSKVKELEERLKNNPQ